MTEQEIREHKQIAYYTVLVKSWVTTSILADIFMGLVSAALFVAACAIQYEGCSRFMSGVVVLGVLFLLLWNRIILERTLAGKTTRKFTVLASVLDWSVRGAFVGLIVAWTI